MNPSIHVDVDEDRSFRVLWQDGDRIFCRGRRPNADGDRDERAPSARKVNSNLEENYRRRTTSIVSGATNGPHQQICYATFRWCDCPPLPRECSGAGRTE